MESTTEEVQIEQPITEEHVITQPISGVPTPTEEPLTVEEMPTIVEPLTIVEPVGTEDAVIATVTSDVYGPSDTDVAMLQSLSNIELLMWVVVWAIFVYISYRLAMFLHRKIMGVVRSFIRFKL